ncbi:sulfate transporter family-domain-containing protein [Globomyces pollinis-pini]|nr:sulfate transporter family-domain-containing protein [Globomyces pollinis-pini]
MADEESNRNTRSRPIYYPRKRSFAVPARSHFVSRSSDACESQYAITAHEIRQQTMSWTFRELSSYAVGESPASEQPLTENGQPSNDENSPVLAGKPSLYLPTQPAVVPEERLDETEHNVTETTPLITITTSTSARASAVPAATLNDFTYDNVKSVCKTGLLSLPAVCLAVMLTLLDAMSYGIIVFPHSDPHIPVTGPQAGISMFLVSSIVAQIVYTAGGSAFKGAVGSMMIEVMPFLHIMCAIIEGQMVGKSDHSILATIMVAYAMSTLFTGMVFLLIGIFNLGTVIQFFPRHILVGCIGGIGFFLLLTGIEVTAHIVPDISYEYLLKILEWGALKLWGSSFLVAILLKTIQHFIEHPMLVPIFYISVPIVFYMIVFIFNLQLNYLRQEGWLFNFESATDAPFYLFWTFFDFKEVNWSAVLSTLPTQFALTFFGILHVPINVPALSISTKQDINLSKEIIGHGLSNIASGLIGGTQNYLVYSNSLLYIRSGGDSTISGVLLTIATIVLWIKGSAVIEFVPSIVVGSLIFHLGIDLLKESIFDTWNVGMHPFEYYTIVIIVLVMGVVGFTEGIMVGIMLACIFFVVMYSRRSIIRDTFNGAQLRSTVHRLFRQQNFLDKVGDQTHIIKLQGFMFFGTVNQLDTYIKEVQRDSPRTRFFVLDFSLISGIDYSGLETFLRIKRNLTQSNTHLIFCGLQSLENDIRPSGIFDFDEDSTVDESLLVHIFDTLNDSLEWTENFLLSTYYIKSVQTDPLTVPNSSWNLVDLGRQSIASTPRAQQVSFEAERVINNFPHISSPLTKNSTSYEPFRFLMQALSERDTIDEELLDVFGPKFVNHEYRSGHVIYLSGSIAKSLYIVESGELGLSLADPMAGDKIVETLIPGTMVGELEMFSKRPRICSLVCLSDASVWELSKESFDALSKSHPHVVLKFVTEVAVTFDAQRFYNTVHHWSQLR